MRKVTIIVILALAGIMRSLALAPDTYTVVVSCDGFRWDYPECFDMHFMQDLAADGVKAIMMPSYPSKTFPNHYTLATGLYPDHHGLIGNTFFIKETGKVYSLSNNETRNDPANYGGEPIWITAQKQGVKTATVYWVGSDVAVQGQHPTYWHNYQDKKRLNFDERIDEVTRLLKLPEKDRPRLVMCYFEEPDHSGHSYGPMSRHTRAEAEKMDDVLSKLWYRLKTLPEIGGKINLIVLGDHGMTWQDPSRTVNPYERLNKDWVRFIAGDDPALIYLNSPEQVDSVMLALKDVDHIKVWKKQDVPAYLHFGTNKNMGDVVVMPDIGWRFTSYKVNPNSGGHGADPTLADMHVAFRAIGPDFKVNYLKNDRFPNVDIYSLLAHLIGIVPAQNDGDLNRVADMLAKGSQPK